MAKRLVLTLKGTGFRKVEIVLEDGTMLEGAGDEEEERTDGPSDASPDGPPSSAQAAPAASPAAGLNHGLATLIGRIGALDLDAARKATMAKVAAAASELVKAGRLGEAAATIAKLEQAVDASAAPAAGDLAAAAAQLTAALAAVERQVAALRNALRRTDDDELLVISEIQFKIMLATFVPGLRAALGAVDGADAATQRAAGPALLRAVQDAGRVIGSDPRIAACDVNDFGVAVSIRATLGPALAAMRAALQAGARS